MGLKTTLSKLSEEISSVHVCCNNDMMSSGKIVNLLPFSSKLCGISNAPHYQFFKGIKRLVKNIRCFTTFHIYLNTVTEAWSLIKITGRERSCRCPEKNTWNEREMKKNHRIPRFTSPEKWHVVENYSVRGLRENIRRFYNETTKVHILLQKIILWSCTTFLLN